MHWEITQWTSLADFLAMGGYARYVWGSLGATALLMTLEPMLLMRRRSKLLTRLRRQLPLERNEGKERGERRSD
jgi:heme exporter protein D